MIDDRGQSPYKSTTGGGQRGFKARISLHRYDTQYEQENSAKLTNQRVSYAFTSGPFSFHDRHILPTSKFQHSYSRILLIFYRHQ